MPYKSKGTTHSKEYGELEASRWAPRGSTTSLLSAVTTKMILIETRRQQLTVVGEAPWSVELEKSPTAVVNLTGSLQLCKLQRLKGPVCKIFKQDTWSMYDLIYIWKPFKGEENQINFNVLWAHTFMNVFTGSMLSFDQYKNHKSSKVWHTGPFNVRHCKPRSAESNETTNVETSSPAVWILLNLAEPLRWRGYCGACLASWPAVGVAFAAGWVADVGLVMLWLVTVGDFRSAKWDPKKDVRFTEVTHRAVIFWFDETVERRLPPFRLRTYTPHSVACRALTPLRTCHPFFSHRREREGYLSQVRGHPCRKHYSHVCVSNRWFESQTGITLANKGD